LLENKKKGGDYSTPAQLLSRIFNRFATTIGMIVRPGLSHVPFSLRSTATQTNPCRAASQSLARTKGVILWSARDGATALIPIITAINTIAEIINALIAKTIRDDHC